MNKMKSKVCGSLCFLTFAFLLLPFAFAHAQAQPLKTMSASKIREADIRGNITSIHRAPADDESDNLLGTIMIEGVKEADTNFDKASVRVTNETRVFDGREKERQPTSFDALKTGQKVAARFVGPVAESYPVQATASEIIILN
jgi:hypothetical protein